jgi:hypothetical protein
MYGSTTLDFGTKWRWVVSFAPQLLIPGERAPGTHWIGGWVGCSAIPQTVEKRQTSRICQQSISGLPDCSLPYTYWAIPDNINIPALILLSIHISQTVLQTSNSPSITLASRMSIFCCPCPWHSKLRRGVYIYTMHTEGKEVSDRIVKHEVSRLQPNSLWSFLTDKSNLYENHTEIVSEDMKWIQLAQGKSSFEYNH